MFKALPFRKCNCAAISACGVESRAARNLLNLFAEKFDHFGQFVFADFFFQFVDAVGVDHAD